MGGDPNITQLLGFAPNIGASFLRTTGTSTDEQLETIRELRKEIVQLRNAVTDQYAAGKCNRIAPCCVAFMHFVSTVN